MKTKQEYIEDQIKIYSHDAVRFGFKIEALKNLSDEDYEKILLEEEELKKVCEETETILSKVGLKLVDLDNLDLDEIPTYVEESLLRLSLSDRERLFTLYQVK